MTDRTDQPTTEQIAAALHVLADRIATRPYAVDYSDVAETDGYVLVSFLADEDDARRTLVAGMTITRDAHELRHGGGGLYRWCGTLVGMPLHVLGHPDGEPTAADQPEPQPEPEPAPATVGVWLGCGHRADYASAAEHDRDCPAHGTDPAAAAAEQPAGTVAHWPVTAAVPRQRQRRTWLDRGVPAPGQSSWARAGLAAVLAEPTASLPTHARGLVAMTDPALSGRTDEVA